MSSEPVQPIIEAQSAGWQPSLGAIMQAPGTCRFRVWAPQKTEVWLQLLGPRPRRVPMMSADSGYYEATIEDIEPGTDYVYVLGDDPRPDPASRLQPEGVHGPSRVVDRSFQWTDAGWHGLPLPEYADDELHAGTFSAEGTFDGVIPYLDELKELGITAVEIMPVAQFPGKRNWGYDGVGLFAVQNSYGGPAGLKRLVEACHSRGLAVILDVVYNHLGPEGNYLNDFGPYFTDRYQTPWGKALNFDGAYSDEVRRFFLENALTWITEFHFDALRLDAVHAICDFSAAPFLAELAAVVRQQAERLDRRVHLIAESESNDAKLVRPASRGGYGLDAQWSDDFHHSLHVLLTGERNGYYEDFGRVADLARAFAHGFVFTGQYSVFRKRRHGVPGDDLPSHSMIVCSQNHDQVGNRLLGDRLTHLVSFEQLKVAASAVLLSPYVPLLFMGEEYGETARFQYFIEHSDRAAVEAVRKGRREEFASFGWQGEPPDPFDEKTFERSRLRRSLRTEEPHATLWEFYRELFRLRREVPALAPLNRTALEVMRADESQLILCLRRWEGKSEAVLIFSFSDMPGFIDIPLRSGVWAKRLDSAHGRWHGFGSQLQDMVIAHRQTRLPVSPNSCAVYVRMADPAGGAIPRQATTDDQSAVR